LSRLAPLLLLLLTVAAAAQPKPPPPPSPKTPAKVEPKVEPKVDGPAVKCTIRSIIANESPGGIDKRLAFIKKQLSKPPFSAYRSLRLLEAKEIVVPQDGRRSLTLPNGKILKLTFKERLLGRKDRLRLRLHLSITPPKETRFLPGTLFTIVNHGTLLVAGDKLKDGTLVVGITCQTK